MQLCMVGKYINCTVLLIESIVSIEYCLQYLHQNQDQARLLLLRVKSHDFPTNKLFALGKIALLRPFRHIANADDTKLPLSRSCLYVTFGQRHGENAVIFDTLQPKLTMGKDPKNDLFHSCNERYRQSPSQPFFGRYR